MRIDESPFRCPYPMWLVVATNGLPPILAFIMFMLWREDCSEEWRWYIPVFIVFIVLFWQVLYLPYTIWRELAYAVLWMGSVWVAFRDGAVFGIGYTIVLGLLLIPYYYTQALCRRFARQERTKLQALVGREGITIRHAAPFNMVVEIDGELFDACPMMDGEAVQGIMDGVPVIVLRAGLVGIDVEQKKE